MRQREIGSGIDDGGRFATTQWSLIARAGGVDRDAGREALAVLLRRYLPALRVHLLTRGFRPGSVDDLLQQFVADRVIERNLLSHADAARGRFRSFLLTSLMNFVANVRRSERAAKRSPSSGALLTLDADVGIEPADPAAASSHAADAFDVAWAREALAEAMRRMETACLASARPDLWDVFQERVVRPALHDTEATPYDELARRHQYVSWKQAANALVTAKRRFEDTLRCVLAEHAGDGAAVESELVDLGKALAGAHHFQPDHDGQRE